MIISSRIGFPLIAAMLTAVGSEAESAELPGYTVEPPSACPEVNPGSVMRLIVSSEALADEMTVDVWLPAEYNASRPEGFPVVYAHDGQNLFDPSLSFAGVAWELDAAAGALAAVGEIQPPIIVGIHNRGAKNLRPSDYFPEKALNYIPDEDKTSTLIWNSCQAGFYGDEYAAFVAAELKPLVDSMFNTASDRGDTYTMGSSMGALASLYLLCEYPGVFGGAACLSTHWIGSLVMNPDYTLQPDPVCQRAILDYLDDRLPAPTGRRLYLDRGTEGWDADYQAGEAVARAIVRRHGYSETNATLMTFDAPGAAHNEWSWQQRARRPLAFLLGASQSSIDEVVTDTDQNARPLFDLLGRPAPGHPAPGVYVRNGGKLIIQYNNL